MAAWPDIAEPMFPVKESTEFPTIKTEMDGAYIHLRRKWTKSKKVFQLEWNEKVSMKETDYQILRQFFLEQQGLDFTWTHPATNVIYIVLFNQDSLDSDIIIPGYRALTISLREQ